MEYILRKYQIEAVEKGLEFFKSGNYYKTSCENNGLEVDKDLFNYCPYCGGEITENINE